ncbi:hypothetical protein PTTG_29657 [Puccinia triticina 1-1 BBBD Race 1]|uniref:Tet-like 2OG-Fe(II) oxygenase domain-containing protein n=1 Tax=Puccinia triticina (isolate 1-1 / race 1 (BBBD)) TaxID=630390 RepID=A0A180G2X3_PUCT1|nr:hypothetical protein PTTG_29657 [Puccinia triticina 1-1 BBBD Race 1]
MEFVEISNQNANQRMRRNTYLTLRKRNKREESCRKSFTSAPPPPGGRILTRKVKPIDLFPEITKDYNERKERKEELKAAHEEDPINNPAPSKATIVARVPTEEENRSALQTVKEKFISLDSGYHKIYDERTSEVVGIVEFMNFDDLTTEQFEDLNFLCLFLHKCKEFVNPVSSKSRKCAGIMWMIGWQKGYEGLKIIGRYRCQIRIDANPLGFEALMGESLRAGEVVWKLFHGFGDVAVERNHEHMKRSGIPSFADNNFPKVPGDESPFAFASNLAFSSNGFYNHQHVDSGDLSELPLAFALVIPTSRITGEIATTGYDVQNGQFIFRDIRVALDFKPRRICRMIFRAQEYAHGTLLPYEPTIYTKLGIALQVATKASQTCQKYIRGDYDDDTDKYVGGVDELLGYFSD